MPSLDDIFSVLTSSDKAIAEEDPYSGWGDVASSIAKGVFTPHDVYEEDSFGRPVKMRTAAPTIGEALLTGLIGGGTNMFFKELGKGYRDEQSALARDVFRRSLAGEDVTQPEGLSGSVFNPLANYGTAFRLTQQLANDAEEKKAKREIQSTALGALLKGAVENPRTAARQKAAVMELLGGQAATQPIAETTFRAPTDGTAEPLDFGKYLDRTEGEQGPAEKLFQRDLEAPDRARAAEGTLRAQFLGQPAVQDFTQVANVLAVLQKAKDDPTAVSDLDFVFGAAKALDPNSVVRESEGRQVLETQGIPAKLLGAINRDLSGGQGIQGPTRQAIVDLVGRRYETNKAQVDALKKGFGDIATSYGADPRNVLLVPGEGSPVAAATPRPAGPTPEQARAILRARGVAGF